ncbi:hypothetical protein BOSEA31B_20436 [Hyphomicrobiales bacterium]|nr:hypothetical protein BOSEA31B_20436 [Hyphomicrobiales bacterium]CAH1702189.1 hypothetical protein BOSEA1005_30061 [Hyphomicrobiales bacterium]CAI0346393.1 hypothetical protein BO1005MUT1_510034 [Hyphomicrobiales bacterium]
MTHSNFFRFDTSISCSGVGSDAEHLAFFVSTASRLDENADRRSDGCRSDHPSLAVALNGSVQA